MPRRDFDPFAAVLEFHRRFGVGVGERPGLPEPEVVALRRRLIAEEAAELERAIAASDLVEVADALADLLYVVYGTAAAFGIDVRPVFEEVHRANMEKVGGGKRADGKVLKPAGWQPPRLAPLLAEMRLGEGEMAGSNPPTPCPTGQRGALDAESARESPSPLAERGQG